jgi:hypothetical protein
MIPRIVPMVSDWTGMIKWATCQCVTVSAWAGSSGPVPTWPGKSYERLTSSSQGMRVRPGQTPSRDSDRATVRVRSPAQSTTSRANR